jgi:hypothetical protein
MDMLEGLLEDAATSLPSTSLSTSKPRRYLTVLLSQFATLTGTPHLAARRALPQFDVPRDTIV